MTAPADHPWVIRYQEQLSAYTNSLSGCSDRLNEATKYVLNSGGKHLRALLVYLIGEHYDLSLNKLDPIALAIEFVHAFSLVHDDLPAMDDDDWRRHQATCHKAFDEATAILCGDALLAESFFVLSKADADPKAIVLMTQQLALAVGTHGLCGGQNLDMQATANTCSTKEILFIHAHKTGALFATACELAYLASNQADPKTRETLRDLGFAIGHCLQISDDMLDICAEQKELGKTPGKDKEQNKASYSNLFSLSECKKHCKHWEEKAISSLNTLAIESPALRELIAFLCTRAH